MATIPPVNTHIDVNMPNCTVVALNADNTWLLVQLPGGDVANPVQIWLPFGNGQATMVQSTPVGWPPKEGDLWIVPGISEPGFVVNGGGSVLYFITPDEVRSAYTSHGQPVPPITTDQALATYGSGLTLQFRQP